MAWFTCYKSKACLVVDGTYVGTWTSSEWDIRDAELQFTIRYMGLGILMSASKCACGVKAETGSDTVNPSAGQ